MINELIKSYKKSRVLKYALLIVLILAAWTGGYHYSQKVKTSVPPVNVRVIYGIPKSDLQVMPTDLSNFLISDIKQSDAHNDCGDGYLSYTLLAYKTDQAKLLYGCGRGDVTPIVAKRENGKWSLLSPTNNYSNPYLPECKYVNDNKISKDIEPYCLNQSGDANKPNLELVKVTNP
jgi:hypothetical protein